VQIKQIFPLLGFFSKRRSSHSRYDVCAPKTQPVTEAKQSPQEAAYD
jgi:hypothetical protein